MLTGNKGEWSEIYALFKLLSDQKLVAGDGDLNIIDNLFFPIIKIIRNEAGVNFEYELKRDIVIISGGKEIIRMPVNNFTYQAQNLLTRIKKSSGVFGLEEVEIFMKEINCHSIKADSTTKTDIRIVIYDRHIHQASELGFSIKSQIGGDSTLLNAGRTTNFVYNVVNMNFNNEIKEKINSIDSKRKIKDRYSKIKELKGDIIFSHLEQNIFKNNLILIDSLLPNILSEIIKTYYETNLNKIKDLTNELVKKNPLNFDIQHSHKFYEYKIKRFLTDVALGMMPSKVWDGFYTATGGYLIVKEDGNVLCYHVYNRNQFEDYLYQNTKLETASSTKHKYGTIFTQEDNIYFTLNLQIRFI